MDGVLVFLMPALADDQREPKASPPPLGLAAAGLVPGVEAMDDVWVWVAGAWTEVK